MKKSGDRLQDGNARGIPLIATNAMSGAPGPVWTDQSDFFAGIQLKGSIHEEQLLAILFIDVCERDHFEGATRATVPLPV